MPTGVSILETFSQSYPGLIRLLTVVAYLLGPAARRCSSCGVASATSRTRVLAASHYGW